MNEMTDDDYGVAVKQGHEVALALAIKRFRDEYCWTADMVRAVGHELLTKLDEGVRSELNRTAADLTRIETAGGSTTSMQCAIIAAMALVAAQVSEGMEMSRRARRN